MTIRAIQTIALAWLLLAALSASGDEIKLSSKDATKVRERLKSYTQGKVTLEAASDGEEWGGQVIAFYLTHSNEVTVKMKLPIARCYANYGGFTNVVQLTKEYLNIYTNDARAWDLLAGAQYLLGAFEEGFVAGTNALRFGCERNIAATGGAAVQLERLDVLEGTIAPRLLELKGLLETTTDTKRQMIAVLVAYSLQADKKEIFLKALEGVDSATITGDPKLMLTVERGYKHFGHEGTENVRKLLEIGEGSEPASKKGTR